jgi:multiple sugar transport system ATP-binding protein
MATIELRQVEKKFGESYAVKPMDLTVTSGEFVALLGPSGCGKTTTLRMISGLEAVTGGTITLDGKNVTWLKPADRNLAFVFQFYALYPHISVRDNISFPLRAEGMDRTEMDRRIDEVVEILRIGHLLKLRPGKLSGGDKQRVALARALVRSPAAFLMDEPLGALDAEFREAMRAEIKKLHISQRATTVYVTHDQVEAMAMADRIVVMSAAEVQQIGTPAQVYYDPANLFVARFIGSPGMNLIDGKLAGGAIELPGAGNRLPILEERLPGLQKALGSDGAVVLGFRPEAAALSDSGSLVGEVYATDMHGAYKLLHVSLGGDDILHIRADRMVHYPIGALVRFDIRLDMERFFDPRTGRAIYSNGAQEAAR